MAARPRPPASGTRPLPAIAVTLPQYSDGPGPALAAVEDARRLGFAGGFLFDHLWPLGSPRDRPALECWTLLAALAGVSRSDGGPRRDVVIAEGSGPGAGRFRLGTLVTRAGLRPAALVARMAATVGDVAGTPPIVGVGSGDQLNRAENEAFGLPFRDADGRAAELERTALALRGPLAGRPGPEVWVGGAGRRARAVAGRVADAWNGWALTPDELAAGLADVRRAAERAGRDPATVAATWGGQVLVGEDAAAARAMLASWAGGRTAADRDRVVGGDAERVAARLAELGDAGATWCVLSLVGGHAAELRRRLARGLGLDAPGRAWAGRAGGGD